MYVAALLPRNDLAVFCETQRSWLTDALFLFFLQVGLQVSSLSPLLAVWVPWAGAAVRTMLNVWCICLCSLADNE